MFININQLLEQRYLHRYGCARAETPFFGSIEITVLIVFLRAFAAALLLQPNADFCSHLK
jgi:hypothetical protein